MSAYNAPAPDAPPSSLFLRRPNLEGLPPLAVPSGYALRIADDNDADVSAVGQVLGKAFPDMDWSLEKTRERLWDDATVRARFLVTDAEGLPTATASARIDATHYPDSGYVHWVGADPAHRGKGLGFLATLATLHHFVGLGLADSVLETDDFRIPAIRVYGKLGFRPDLSGVAHGPRWAAIFAAHPDLATLLENHA